MEDNESPIHLRVRLVINDRGWILEKMARRLLEHLPRWNVQADIASHPSTTADINHWMLYYDMGGRLVSRNTLAITHVDRLAKLQVLKRRLKSANMGICMSRMTLEQLISLGVPRDKLCFITPGHDNILKPKRIVIGITSQIRADGAKREHVLIEVAKAMRLDYFHFEIIGPNWEKIIPFFEVAGATVNYYPGEYKKNNEEHLRVISDRIRGFDYYLYMGWDEGSMGILDALTVGIPTIVTPQGFHLDIDGGITHAFTDAEELIEILKKLESGNRARVLAVSQLTWTEYARQHAILWRLIVQNENGNVDALLHKNQNFPKPLDVSRSGLRTTWWNMRTRTSFFSFKEDLSLLWRVYTGRKLERTLFFRLARFLKRMTLRILN